jgi:hypothetical protein
MRNHLADVVKLIERIREYRDVPLRYKARLKPRVDSVTSARYVDMRALLTVRLLKLGTKPAVVKWVSDWKKATLKEPVSAYDIQLLKKLL